MQIPELRTADNVVLDNTAKDTLHMARSCWEAKGSHDELETKSKCKFDQGNPRYSIVF